MNRVEKTVMIRGGNAPPVVQRDDGLWSIGWHEDAPGPFESRRFAEAVSGVTHAPA